jgi:hypothetical protein
MKRRIEELMELKEKADERAERRAKADAAAEERAARIWSKIALSVLDEIEASDDPKAKIAELRQRYTR